MEELWNLTKQWHKDRAITINGNSKMQTIKLGEEFGELCAGIARDDKEKIKDSIGDMLVVLTAIAELENLDLKDCWQSAYDEIKDRKGTLLPNGNFLKESDYRCELCIYFNNNFCEACGEEVDKFDICERFELKGE